MSKSFPKLLAIGLVGAALLASGLVCLFTPKREVGTGAFWDERFPLGSWDINYDMMRGAMGGWWRDDFSISEVDFSPTPMPGAGNSGN
jgi:hypothetical protein